MYDIFIQTKKRKAVSDDEEEMDSQVKVPKLAGPALKWVSVPRPENIQVPTYLSMY